MLLWMIMWMACAPEAERSLPTSDEGAFVPSGPPAPGPLPAVSLGVLADIQQETGVCWLVGQTGAGVAVVVPARRAVSPRSRRARKRVIGLSLRAGATHCNPL